MLFFAKLDKNISGINSFVNKLLSTKTIYYLRKSWKPITVLFYCGHSVRRGLPTARPVSPAPRWERFRYQCVRVRARGCGPSQRGQAASTQEPASLENSFPRGSPDGHRREVVLMSRHDWPTAARLRALLQSQSAQVFMEKLNRSLK